MIKHFFFDLDGTVCESRQPISLEMEEALDTLMKKKYDVIITSGAERERMFVQLENLIPNYLLPQSGADSPFWKKLLTQKEKETITKHVNKVKGQYPQHLGCNENDLLQDRGCQMTFSFIGHHACIHEKRIFDTDKKIRKAVLKKIPFKSSTLAVNIAGTTCFDYTRKDSTKGKNIKKFIKYLKWKKEDCIYFGDALFKGGNDATVKGVIKTVGVKGPDDLLLKLDKYII